eukprot:snap_masked-scaffold_6-processed-gene-5.20-mRNA-1 protein AED:1.00 eAED:1.00 QI:0/-1/0/0/-1/1/1/0/101
MNGSWGHNLETVKEASEMNLITKNWRKKLSAEGISTNKKRVGLRSSYTGPRAARVLIGYSPYSNYNVFRVPGINRKRGVQVARNRAVGEHASRLNSSRKGR